MDLVLEKQIIKNKIDTINDESLVHSIKILLDCINEPLNLNPNTIEGFKNRNNISTIQIEEGKTISSSRLREEIKKWSLK
jgi:H2-forming N5,N10-methylenetetrahydromethanopterin dehydrogenase-like enzyme